MIFINIKMIGQYLLNGIISFFGSWLIVVFLRTGLPSSLTHGNIPEIPPTFISDWILILSLIIFSGGFSWLLNTNFSYELASRTNQFKWMRLINLLSAAFILLSIIGISLVVNEGTFADVMGNLLSISQWIALILTLINLFLALRGLGINWYRLSLLFQILAIIVFWLNLWISPA